MEAKNIYNENADCIERWHHNTELAVDLKTRLLSDRYARTGRQYRGVLRRDSEAEIEDFRCRDPHYTFTEEQKAAPVKRNPHVFRGRYVNITRAADGTLRPNFRPMPQGRDLIPARYASAVANELLWALEGLVEK